MDGVYTMLYLRVHILMKKMRFSLVKGLCNIEG